MQAQARGELMPHDEAVKLAKAAEASLRERPTLVEVEVRLPHNRRGGQF